MLKPKHFEALKWAIERAKEWRGSLMPEDTGAFDDWVRDAEEALELCNVAKPAPFTGHPKGVVHPELYAVLNRFDNTIDKAIVLFTELHPNGITPAQVKLQRKPTKKSKK